MADIELRFHRDMLVLSSSVSSALARQGVDADQDLEFMNLVEPETIQDILRMEKTAGAQCLVLGTRNMTPAQLARRNMEDRAFELSVAVLAVAKNLKPQHMIVEIGPCGLPLDVSSKESLNEHRRQYAQVARVFEKSEFDAYLLDGFVDTVTLKCALMGIRQVSDRPVFVSVEVDASGNLTRRGTLEEAVQIMAEFGAQVAGFSTKAGVDEAVALANQVVSQCDLPVLVQLDVVQRNPKQGISTPENPYYCADIMEQAAPRLRAAGVQFLRAVGDASPAYTGALAACTAGFDVAPIRFQG